MNGKTLIAICAIAAAPVVCARQDRGGEQPFSAVKAIVGRLAGGYDGAADEGRDRAKAAAAMAKFVFARLPGEGERATVGPDASGRRILIRATCESAAAFALGRYVRDVQKGCVSWSGSRIPSEWPVPRKTVAVEPSAPVRFAYNYCTLSYTMAFWSAAEWREELDRIALSGFNCALLLQGLPAVWRSTLASVVDEKGNRVFSDADIRAFISDEAAEAWWHMGNLEGLGGPLSDERIDNDAKLGRWLYREMMRLGIKPCLQSYIGFVPNSANAALGRGVGADGAAFGSDPGFFIIDQGRWQGYARPDVLNPSSKAFDFLAERWYAALKNVYRPDVNGWTGYMCGDLFHEGGRTGKLSDADIAATAAKIQASQMRHFGNGGRNHVTWVLQNWGGNPKKSVLDGLDPKHTLIQVLDSYLAKDGDFNIRFENRRTGERFQWIWAGILNFGGKQGMHGGLRRLRTLSKAAAKGPSGDTFRGYGMLSEGLETSPAMYELFTDIFAMPSGSVIDDAALAGWWRTYARRRYGVAPDGIVAALETLGRTVFNNSNPKRTDCVEYVFCADPSLNVRCACKWGWKGGPEHNPAELVPAAQAYLDAASANPRLMATETFRFDFCELFTQVLAERMRTINPKIGAPGAERDEFFRLLDLAERLLASEPRCTLAWHEARTARTAGAAGARGYRRMVTSWTGNWNTARKSGLRDYAYRAYSGLVKDYYAKRWEWFIELNDGKIGKDEYEARLKRLDRDFPTAKLEATPPGDLTAIARELKLRDTANDSL